LAAEADNASSDTIVKMRLRIREAHEGCSSLILHTRTADQKTVCEPQCRWKYAEHFIVTRFGTFFNHANLLLWKVRNPLYFEKKSSLPRQIRENVMAGEPSTDKKPDFTELGKKMAAGFLHSHRMSH
jgi:hypothetical protein